MAVIGEKDHGNGAQVYNAALTATKKAPTTDTQVLIWSVTIHNTTAARAYVQFFDALAADVTVGTTTPDFVVGVAANGTTSWNIGKPIRFSTGITVASTTTRAGSTDATQEVCIVYTSNP